MPIISVIMTAYNAEKYIRESIDSILHQTLSDFEFLILNDGSTDGTLNIIKSYTDNRIIVIEPGKIGYYAAKMTLIEAAKSDFIAIMDADDIANKDRLRLQYQFLLQNNEYGMVGSRAEWIDSNSYSLQKEFPFVHTNEQIRPMLLFSNCFVHTSVMIRRSVLVANNLNYRKIAGEDFDLWIRIAQRAKVYNLDCNLIKYRIHPNNMCHSDWYKLGEGISSLLKDELNNYFPNNICDLDVELHLSLVEFSLKNNIRDIPDIIHWVQKLVALNQTCKHFEEQILKQILYERILKKWLRLNSYNYSVFQSLMQMKKELQPTLTLELRKKEMAIFAFSVLNRKFISL